MSYLARKQNAPRGNRDALQHAAGQIKDTVELTTTDYTTAQPDCLQPNFWPAVDAAPNRRRLDPKVGALIKLDVVEHRLHVANTTGDNDTWVRFFQAWLCLHSLAFFYGRWAKGAGQ